MSVHGRFLKNLDKTEEKPLYILPPRRKLLRTLAVLWGVLTLLIVIGHGIFLYVAIPIFVYWLILFYLFAKTWRICHYSLAALIIATVLLVVLLYCVVTPV